MLRLDNIDFDLTSMNSLERKILSGLNLQVKEGQFVTIIGGNGAGKTSLLNIISGMLKPSIGNIYLEGKNMTNIDQSSRSLYISKVVQDPKIGTIENMTIFENLAFASKRGKKRGLSKFCSLSNKTSFKEKLKILNMNLENRIDDLVNNLSGGQRQALSVLMSILSDCKILLLDEVTAALDPLSSELLMKITAQIVKEKKITCIAITHNMLHAIKYGDRLLILEQGKFIKEYSKEEKLKLSPSDLLANFK